MKEEYIIHKNLVKEIVDTLSSYQFSDCGQYNNDEVIDCLNKLDIEIKKQDEGKK